MLPLAFAPICPSCKSTTVDTESHSQELSILVAAIQQLSLTRTIEQVQRVVVEVARKLVNCDGVTFVFREDDNCHYADENAVAPLWKGKRFPMEQCISGWVMLKGQSVVIGDIYQDSRIPADAYRTTFVKSLAMVPIRQSQPIGALGAYWANHHVASPSQIELLQALADSTSVALENIELYQTLEVRVASRTAELQQAYEQIRALSITDELTGLNNRRGFYLLGEQFIKERVRDKEGLTLLCLDLDNLKTINDTYGHAAGDDYIQLAARALQSLLRESDVAVRLGGDEFAILAKGFVGEPIKNRIIAAFDKSIIHQQYSLPLRASIGYVQTDNLSTINLFDLIKQADCEMYRAKQQSKSLNSHPF
ncbi:MAG: diguanylate cyclase [Cellvibrio sp.]